MLAWTGFLSCSLAQQDEVISLTSYYPVPFGSYNTVSTDKMSVGTVFESEAISDDSLIVSGNIGLGSPGFVSQITSAVPSTGYLQVNDIWLRSVNRWASASGGNVTVTRYGNFLPKSGPICHGDPASLYYDALRSTNLGEHNFCALTCIVRSDNQDPRQYGIPGCTSYLTPSSTGRWQVMVYSMPNPSNPKKRLWRLRATDNMGSGPYGTRGCAICLDWN